MMKKFMFAMLALVAVTANAAPKPQAKPYWLDPSVNRVGTEQSRASFFAYESAAKARKSDKAQSARYLSMEGQWKFKFVTHHYDAPKGFEAVGFDDASWELFPVPGLFELNGHGDRIYKNVGYAWNTQFENKPGFVEEKNNYTGSYRRTFQVPAAWKGQDIYIHVGSATSNLRLWVNGKEVGYSEDSKMEAETISSPCRSCAGATEATVKTRTSGVSRALRAKYICMHARRLMCRTSASWPTSKKITSGDA